MPQFFIDTPLACGGIVSIRGGDAKHIASVLRLKAGESLRLTNGDGETFSSTIVRAHPREVIVEVSGKVSVRNPQSAPVLAQAVIKHDRMEWIIQKGVELGVTRIIPFRSERTVPQLVERVAENKLERWRSIALAAAKQSGLPFRPEIDPLQRFEDLTARFSSYKTSLLLWEEERSQDLRTLLRNRRIEQPCIIIIGPEGGFARNEVEQAIAAGAQSVSLGPQILRVETASLVTISILQYELGCLSVSGVNTLASDSKFSF